MTKDKTCFLIFPNQLYEDITHLKKYHTVFLIEEPIYFYDPVHRPIKPNKIKIAYMRACMKAYFDFKLKQIVSLSTTARYIEYTQAKNYNFLKNFKNVTYFDVVDHALENKLHTKISSMSGQVTRQPSPNFILSNMDLKEYHAHHGKSPRHSSFYEYVKLKLGILKNVKNQDSLIRKPPPKVHLALKVTHHVFSTMMKGKLKHFTKETLDKGDILEKNLTKDVMGLKGQIAASPRTFVDQK